MWKTLHIAEEKGSEGGVVCKDEEYKGACRITLEKCPRYYAITCAIYGGMVHTAFCGPDDHESTYEEMKKELQQFIDKGALEEGSEEFFQRFTEKY